MVKWRCKKCNFIFERTPANFLRAPKCPNCESKFNKMTIEIIKQLNS